MAQFGKNERHYRDLNDSRNEFIRNVRELTNGIYFPRGKSILPFDDGDAGLAAAMCPEESFDATEKGLENLKHVFLEANRWWIVMSKNDPNMFWCLVAKTAARHNNIRLSKNMARDLTHTFLKARQRWLLRQKSEDPESTSSVFVGAMHRLLLRFQELSKDENPSKSPNPMDLGWKLSEKERNATKESLVRMGPKKKLSAKKYQLTPDGSQILYPISDFGSTKSIRDMMGLVDKLVETMTPSEALKALLPLHFNESKFMLTSGWIYGKDQKETENGTCTPNARQVQEQGDDGTKCRKEGNRIASSPQTPTPQPKQENVQKVRRVPQTPLKTKHLPAFFKPLPHNPAPRIKPEVKNEGPRPTASPRVPAKRRYMSEDLTQPGNAVESMEDAEARVPASSSSMPPATPLTKKLKKKAATNPLRQPKR